MDRSVSSLVAEAVGEANLSEYQYYEFHAIDRPLTQSQIQELRRYSTRATITPTRFVNEYHWGSFKGNPAAWMEKHFDAFFYLANWGTREFMLRLPGRALDIEEARRYCCGDSAVARRKGEWVILEFHSNDEDSEWEADGPQLSALIPLRSDLAKGDYRCLYLAWLRCVQAGEIDDDEAEPPVPRGLRTMTGPLDAFVEIMHIERDLLAAAAERSEDAEELVPRNEIETWIRSLSEAEKVRLLVEAVVAGATPQAELLKRFRDSRDPRQCRAAKARTVAELLAAAEKLADERRRKETERANRERDRREEEERRARERYLKNLAPRKADVWVKVDQLIASKQPKKYDEAVALLRDLRDLGRRDGNTREIGARLRELQIQHQGKPTFIRRLREAGLLDVA